MPYIPGMFRPRRPVSWSRTIHWSVGLVVGAALAACGSEPANTGSPQPTSTGTPAPTAAAAASLTEPCTLLPAATASKVFGVRRITAVPKPPQMAANGMTMYGCEYRATVYRTVLGGLLTGATNASVSPEQVSSALATGLPNARPVQGVGESAIISVGSKQAIVAASKRVSGQTIVVMYTGSPRLTEEQLVALVKPAIDAL